MKYVNEVDDRHLYRCGRKGCCDGPKQELNIVAVDLLPTD